MTLLRPCLSLLLLFAAAEASSAQSGAGVDLPGIWLDAEHCLVVRNRGVDSAGEVFDQSGERVRRAGTWRGREGRYVIVPPAGAGARIRLHAFGAAALTVQDVELSVCPERLPIAAAAKLAEAMDLRLRAYLGEAVDQRELGSLFAEALEGVERAGLPDWQADILIETAQWHFERGRLEQAVSGFQSALLLHEAGGDWAGVASAANSLGQLAWRLGRLDAARQHYQRALALRLQLGERYAAALLLNNLGLLAAERGRPEQAVEDYEQSLEILQGTIDLRLRVEPPEAGSLAAGFSGDADLPAALNTLNNLAAVYSQTGQVDVAERYWRNYLAFEAFVPEAAAPARAALNLGRMLTRQGRLDEALILMIDALAVFDQSRSSRWQAEARIGLSELYQRLGDREGAIEYARQASSLELGETRTRALVLHHRALLAVAAGEHALAQPLLHEAAGLMTASISLRESALVDGDLAMVELDMGRVDQAFERQRAAYDVLSESGYDRDSARALSQLGEIRRRQGRLDEALEMLQQALAGHLQADDAFAEIETLQRIGRVHSTRGASATDRRREVRINARAIERAQSMSSTALPALRRAEFLESMRELYDRQIDLLLSLKEPEQAWSVAGRARFGIVRELHRTRARAQAAPRRKAMLDQRAATISQLHVATLERSPANSQQRDHELLPLRRELDRIGTSLRMLDEPSSASHGAPDLDQVQRSLGPNRLLLSYYRRADSVVLWVIDGATARVQRVADDALEEAVSELLVRLRNPRNAPGRIDQLTSRLGRLLLGPAADEIAAAEEVVIQADGVLYSLPFALLSPVPGEVPSLVEYRDVRQILSVAQADFEEPLFDSESSMLVLADPGWKGAQHIATRFPEHSLLNRLLRDRGLAGLPGARLEAEAIVELTGGAANVRFSMGPNATRESLLAGGLSGYRLVHLATHGLVDLEYPELSSLLLASANGAGPAFLRPHEIAELDIDAELVVLSACETGLGKTFAGSGAFSLARPFLVAGAGQVLASLWKVDDHRTALFMQRFYRHLLTESRAPARALAMTQRWMRQQPATAHPYYWAGFVLTAAGLNDPQAAFAGAPVHTTMH